jgi:hypothetical protein
LHVLSGAPRYFVGETTRGLEALRFVPGTFDITESMHGTSHERTDPATGCGKSVTARKAFTNITPSHSRAFCGVPFNWHDDLLLDVWREREMGSAADEGWRVRQEWERSGDRLAEE